MGKMAEIQRRLLEVCPLSLVINTKEEKEGRQKLISQQMMGPEAMGIKQQNYDWWDEKVCRNFLFGTCPHLVFGNTVRQSSERSEQPLLQVS